MILALKKIFLNKKINVNRVILILVRSMTNIRYLKPIYIKRERERFVGHWKNLFLCNTIMLKGQPIAIIT